MFFKGRKFLYEEPQSKKFCKNNRIVHIPGVFFFLKNTLYLGSNDKLRCPNILFCISDDQSWIHNRTYGSHFINTPAFDKIAKEGVLFNNCITPAPQCSPARAALLTGRNPWQLEEACLLASLFPTKYKVYPDILEHAGYHVGYTGKGWGPGDWKQSGWKRNPAGNEYNQIVNKAPTAETFKYDYAANFKAFLKDKKPDQPFCFWYGGYEPHRPFEKGSGVKAGMKIEDAKVPDFLPDNEIVRGDILDYAYEIEWFDSHLARMIKILEDIDQLDNTLIMVTSDNGMAFPRAKANNYEYGTLMPMAIRWPNVIKSGRIVDDLISFIDIAPTFLEAALLNVPNEMTGKSLMPILRAQGDGIVDSSRNFVLTGRERHTHARDDNLGYPIRSIRTQHYLYIRNFTPERWPAGDPESFYDIDGSPTKEYILKNKKNGNYFELACSKRPKEELYDIRADRTCLKNLAEDAEYSDDKARLWEILEKELVKQQDPRILGYGDIFESYPRVSPMRTEQFKGFSKRDQYNPEYQRKAERAKRHLKEK
jgi:uncharacterized sulfatase